MIQLVRRGGAVCLLVGMLVVAGLPGLRGADSRAAFAASAAQSGPARVRFVNATPDAAPLDVYVDAALYVGGLTAASGYMDADPGHHTIHVRHSGGSTDAATAQVTLAGDQRVTVATSVNESGSVEIQVIEDDVSAPARNAVRIKVVHVAPGIGPVTVTVSG
ncbi:MAG: DUF4397 domain-containing protein, partial [Anaerolineae bacterium]|nr:DUF4397 domain-containing protein [Anaerolineae bacterium]